MKWVLDEFQRAHGRARLAELWREKELPLPLKEVEDLNNWVSLAFLETLVDALVEASGGADFLTRAGRAFVTPESLGFPYYLLRGMGTPLLAYRKTVELGPNYNRVGSYTIEHAAPTELTLSYRSSVPERNRHTCIGRMGTFAAYPLIWDLPEAEIVELQCQVRGADCCRYHLTWRNLPPRPWLRLAGAALGGVIGAVLSPYLGHGAYAFAVGGFFLGAWLDLRRSCRQKDQLLEEQTRGMTSSVRELQLRADEVFTANLELDQRVADRTRELAEALERLKQVDSHKSELFANVSHELRTPLTLIVGPVEERLANSDDAVERELLSGIKQNARRLLRLIDDILDMSRIEAGHLRLEVVPVDLPALAAQVVAVYRPTAELNGVTLEALGADAVGNVHGDLHRLEMVVSNLVGNAIKYTARGGHVTLTVAGTSELIRLSVQDTGIGIAPEELARVFERFYQTGTSRSRQRGGFGIGLALASNLAQLHGGRVDAHSALGQGSTFTLELPRGNTHFAPQVVERRRIHAPVPDKRRETDAPEAPRVTPLPFAAVVALPDADALLMDDGSRPRVLVVEDNDELRALLEQTLAPIADVHSRPDGEQGLAAARTLHPDLVLTDLMMPGMSGLELCDALKADPALRNIPVIVVTARSGPDSMLDGFAHGADDFVEKPFHPRVLRARVTSHLRARALALSVTNSSRLAAVGTLAAGVGHEVRNPVNAVLNGVLVLKQRKGTPAEAQPLLDIIEDGARRIDAISAALLAHASPGDGGGSRPTSPADGLTSTLALLQHRLTSVQVHASLGCAARVVAPAVELNQVLLNLVDNALRAPASNLWLNVETHDSEVVVTVADDGPGISEEVASRLFSPFFTTRAPGEGTGLGLYLSRNLAAKWGGRLMHAPRPGGGTVFSLSMPRVSA